MIRNLTEDLKFDAECYLYWLHDVSEKDISTEGYVGITLNPDKRCKSHESNFQTRKEGQYLDISVYDFNDVVFEIVHCGSQSEVEDFERTLRPTKGIGWNRGAGGGTKTGHFECHRGVDASIMATVFSVNVEIVNVLVKKAKNTISGKVVNTSRYYSETMIVNGKVRHLNESIFNEHLSTLFDLLKVGDVAGCKDYLESHSLKYDSFRKYLRYTGLNKEL